MDFDELDEVEERQRWALNEIKKTQAQQLQRAAQEQYKQWTTAVPTRPKEVPEANHPETCDTSAPVGLAGFAAPVWRMRTTPEPDFLPGPLESPSTPSVPSRRPRGFAKFQEMRRDGGDSAAAAPASSVEAHGKDPSPSSDLQDPMQAFAQRLMVHAQEERQLQRSWEQLQSGECGLPVLTSTQDDDHDDLGREVPALNALIAILDEEEKEEQELEQLKPYLPSLGTKATNSIVPAGKDGSNPFVTQAVEVFQRFYPDVDLSSAFGDHYQEVLRAAAHRSARGGHIEELQLRNVQRAEEERRAQEERRKLLRELRQRRYLIQERQRALGSLGDTKISTKVRASMPEAMAVGAHRSESLGGAPNGLLFPDMEGTSLASASETAPAVCFPRTTASETLPAKAKTKPLGLLASLKLAEDEDDSFTLEELTGLPSKAKSAGYSRRPDARGRGPGRAEREEAERELRAAEQQQRLERLKERRLQRDKAKVLEAPLGKVMSWGPASELRVTR